MFRAVKNWWLRVSTRPVMVSAPSIEVKEPVGNGPELQDVHHNGVVKLGIIVGHTQENPGAQMSEPYNYSEYAYNKIIASYIKKAASDYHGQIDVEIIYRDGVGIAGAYARARQLMCDALIELHFNALNKKEQGSQTLCTPDVSDCNFAHIVHKKVCEIFARQGASYGVKAVSKSDRGGANVHSFPGGVNCLVEPFFGDNPVEAKLAVESMQQYADALVKAVYAWGVEVDLLR